MILAAAQTSPGTNTIEENLREHYKLIERAAKEGVDFILFPEMSITGYQRETAEEFFFSQDDLRLVDLSAGAKKFNMTIVVGAPFRIKEGSALDLLSLNRTVQRRFIRNNFYMR